MMKMSYLEQKRRDRLDEVVVLVGGLQPVKFAKLVGLITVQFGVQQKKAEEYIRNLLQAEALKMENGEVSVV